MHQGSSLTRHKRQPLSAFLLVKACLSEIGSRGIRATCLHTPHRGVAINHGAATSVSQKKLYRKKSQRRSVPQTLRFP